MPYLFEAQYPVFHVVSWKMYRFTFFFLTIAILIGYGVGVNLLELRPFMQAELFALITVPCAVGIILGGFRWFIRTRDLVEDLGSTLSAFVYVLTMIGVGMGLYGSWMRQHTFLYVDNQPFKPLHLRIENWQDVHVPSNTFMVVSIPKRDIIIHQNGERFHIPQIANQKRFFCPNTDQSYLEYAITYGRDTFSSEKQDRLIEYPRWFSTSADFIFDEPPEKLPLYTWLNSGQATRHVLLRVTNGYVQNWRKARRNPHPDAYPNPTHDLYSQPQHVRCASGIRLRSGVRKRRNAAEPHPQTSCGRTCFQWHDWLRTNGDSATSTRDFGQT